MMVVEYYGRIRLWVLGLLPCSMYTDQPFSAMLESVARTVTLMRMCVL